MKKLFWKRISSTSGLGSAIIVLDNVLELCLELIKYKMVMAMKSSIWFSGSKKIIFLVEISKKSNISKQMRKSSRKALLLYELFEREPGRRFSARCHVEFRRSALCVHWREPGSWPPAGPTYQNQGSASRSGAGHRGSFNHEKDVWMLVHSTS